MKGPVTIAVVVILTAIISASLAVSYHNHNLAEAKNQLEEDITLGFLKLREMTNKLYRSLPTDTIGGLINDCPKPLRQRFDEYLNRLGTLDSNELEETTLLFSACADYYALRERLSAVEFASHIEAQTVLVNLYSYSSLNTSFLNLLGKYEEFSDIKKRQAELLEQQVSVQEKIVDSLKAGAEMDSEAIKEALNDAKTINQEGSQLARRLEEVYSVLSSLMP
jgi:hypothetical protein